MAYKRNRFGSIVLTNDYGKEFTITKKEQQEIKTLVKRANQRRLDKAKRYYDTTKNQPNMKGISKLAYTKLLNAKGFITEKYSSNMRQFKSKEDVKDYIKELKTVTKRGYGNNRLNDIRESMQRRLIETYGKTDTEHIRNKINNMKDSELLSLYLNNDNLIEEIYGSDIDHTQIQGILNRIDSNIDYYLTKTSARKNKVKLRS